MVALLGDERQVQAVRVRRREAGVAVRRPLHRCAHAVAVAEVDVVAHPDLVAVVQDRRAGQREQQRVEQLDLAPVVAEQRREAPADAEVDAHLGIDGVRPQHQVAFLVGDHLQRQLVVVAQERGPLPTRRRVRRLLHDVDDRRAVLEAQRHEEARHHRELEVHVALHAVTVAEVRRGILRPLVGLGEQHASRVLGVDVGAQPLQDSVGLGQVLAVRALALVEVGDGIEAQPVDTHVEPEVEDLEHGLLDHRVGEVEVGLVGVEAVPEVRLGHRVPRPVRGLEVLEDDAGVGVALGVVAPHVGVTLGRAARRTPGALEPRVLVGRVVDDQLGDDAEAAVVGGGEEAPELAQVAVVAVDGPVVGDVVAVVAPR